MANYKVKDGKVFADVSKLTEEELKAVKNYISLGYTLTQKEFKKGITKDEMLNKLSAAPEVKKDFETAYSIKLKNIEDFAGVIEELGKKYGIRTKTKEGKPVVGYHLACQIFSKWDRETNK